MASPTLSKTGVTTVTFSRANVYPHVMPRILSQFVGVSDANTVRVAKVGPPLQTIVLDFEELTVEDREAIEAFFTDPLIDFGMYTFQFTDRNGVVYNVRYLEPQFALPEVTHDNVKFEMILTIV